MADLREMRIFSADQIEVPDDLPGILKDYSKEVIRNNPEDIYSFSRKYFEDMLKKREKGETGDVEASKKPTDY